MDIPKDSNNLVNCWVMNNSNSIPLKTNNVSSRGNNFQLPRLNNAQQCRANSTRFRSNVLPNRYHNINNRS